MQNLKAHTTVEYPSVFGPVTVIVLEDATVMFRAYEIASLLGFGGVEGCINRYAPNATYVELKTKGGLQRVKCIPYEDLVNIGIHSRTLQAADFIQNLYNFSARLVIKVLKQSCAQHRREMEHYREYYQKCCERAVCLAEESAKLSAELLEELKNRCE